jgi:hypothetical protein
VRACGGGCNEMFGGKKKMRPGKSIGSTTKDVARLHSPSPSARVSPQSSGASLNLGGDQGIDVGLLRHRMHDERLEQLSEWQSRASPQGLPASAHGGGPVTGAGKTPKSQANPFLKATGTVMLRAWWL